MLPTYLTDFESYSSSHREGYEILSSVKPLAYFFQVLIYGIPDHKGWVTAMA
jgi:hypothetical protein